MSNSASSNRRLAGTAGLITGVLALGLILSACASGSDRMAAAADAEPGRAPITSDTCGWDGTAGSIFAQADAKVTELDLNAMATEVAGREATVSTTKARQLNLHPLPGPTAADPTDALGLPSATVVYSLAVVVPEIGPDALTWNLQLAYTGLCFNDAVIHPSPWFGSAGAQAPELELAAALAAADTFRAANPDQYPANFGLAGVALQESTTAPPDFGLLRWYVNYSNPDNPNELRIVAVYMDGRTINPVG
jgi:hypothetical protein